MAAQTVLRNDRCDILGEADAPSAARLAADVFECLAIPLDGRHHAKQFAVIRFESGGFGDRLELVFGRIKQAGRLVEFLLADQAADLSQVALDLRQFPALLGSHLGGCRRNAQEQKKESDGQAGTADLKRRHQ